MKSICLECVFYMCTVQQERSLDIYCVTWPDLLLNSKKSLYMSYVHICKTSGFRKALTEGFEFEPFNIQDYSIRTKYHSSSTPHDVKWK